MNLSPEISSSLRHAANVIQSAYAQAYWLPTNQRRYKAARNVRYASNSDRILRRSETTLCAIRDRRTATSKTQKERPPRGGLSEIRSGVSIRRLRLVQREINMQFMLAVITTH